MKLKNKRGEEIITEQVIFFVLNIIFFIALIVFVVRSGNLDGVIEQVYAKKIGLIIDNMKPGMEINLKLDELFNKLEKNNFKGEFIKANNNILNLKIKGNSKGYNFNFFSDVKPEFSFDRQNKILIIKT